MGLVPISSGSSTVLFNTQSMRRFVTDLADQFRHSPVFGFEFADTTINIAATTKQNPTTAYLKRIISVPASVGAQVER